VFSAFSHSLGRLQHFATSSKQPKAVNPICLANRGRFTLRVTKHRSDGDEKAVPLLHSNGLFVVFSEVGAGQEIRHQTPGQPRPLDVALGLSFKTPTQLNSMEIAVRSSASWDGKQNGLWL